MALPTSLYRAIQEER